MVHRLRELSVPTRLGRALPERPELQSCLDRRPVVLDAEAPRLRPEGAEVELVPDADVRSLRRPSVVVGTLESPARWAAPRNPSRPRAWS